MGTQEQDNPCIEIAEIVVNDEAKHRKIELLIEAVKEQMNEELGDNPTETAKLMARQKYGLVQPVLILSERDLIALEERNGR